MISIQGFDHITFAVSNLGKSVAFYRDVLGASVVRESDHNASLRWGSLEISLFCDHATEMPEIRRQLGFQHVAVRVDSPEFFRAVEWLKSHNVTFTSDVVQRGEGWSVNFLDPDGIELELHAPQ